MRGRVCHGRKQRAAPGLDRTLPGATARRASRKRFEGLGLPLALMTRMVLVVGSLAALCSISAFVPQAWRIVKTRKTADLSSVMWTLQVIGFAVWIVYGVMLGAWPIVAENIVCVVLAGFILVMKLLPHHLRHAVADRIDPDVPTP
jgi:MtN3 and saliva related transmembrane protein